MKINRLFLLFILLSIHYTAQTSYLIGKVGNEVGQKLPFASIINLRTDKVVNSDKNGNFVIEAKPFDEIRIARSGYERKLISLTENDFSKPIEVKLIGLEEEIEEVKLSFRPTGNLKKDVKAINPSKRVVELNNALVGYMRMPMTEVVPKSTIPSAFKQPDYNLGQVNMVKLAGAVVGLVKKSVEVPKTKANYTETQEFYNRVKESIDLDYYYKYGMSEYDFDIFLAYADQAAQLSKNFRQNFTKSAIEFKLKEVFVEYLKTNHFSVKKNKA